MPDDTTILSLPLILPAQAQKHVTHNEALVQLDLIVQLAVIDRVLTTAPALPSIGERHIVAAGATGPWVGQSGRVALYSVAGWQFTQPLPGWQAHVLAEGQTAVFDGLAWKAPSDGPLTVTRLGVAATADAVNRLSVSSPATLLNHAGAGHQLKLNKAAAGDTASLLFQTGFGGRAEMGTAGSDDFAVKVSADGAAWFTALEADAASGEVTLPRPVHLGGQAADPGAPADGMLWLNATTGEVKVRSGGVTLPVGGGGGGGGVSDGDKGDISVSGGGTAWTIDPGVVTLAKLADIATDSFLGRDTAGAGVPEVLTPAQARGILNVADGANAYGHPNHSGDVTSVGDGATTIASDAVTNGKLADMASGTIKGRATAGTGDPEDLTGAQATALLEVFTSGEKGLAPASGGGTANFLRADGTWAAPGGGGTPGGAFGEVQWNNGGAFAGAADVEIEAGQLRLPAIATPAVPAAGGVKLYGKSVGGRVMPVARAPVGGEWPVQAWLGRAKVGAYLAAGNGGTDTQFGAAWTGTGTSTTANVTAGTNLHQLMRRREWLVTTAATTAVAGFRGSAAQWLLGGQAAGLGGFHKAAVWGPATGVATATTRGFFGMRGSTAAPTDVNPSTLTNICGMGWDSGDANLSFMHNDASGTATKIGLGASFPRPSADRTSVYRIELFAPPGTAQVLTYEVTDLVSGAVATGSVATDLPSTATLLTPWSQLSVGGTSSVIGMMLSQCYIESDT